MVGPLRPTPAHPSNRVPRTWIAAYAGGFVNVKVNVKEEMKMKIK